MRVYIIANGEPDLPDALQSLIGPTDKLVCADGGSNHAFALGLTPSVIIGDMDSILAAALVDYEKRGVEIRRYPSDKDASDLELALQAALEYSPDEVVCLCALGGRQDHALTNTLLLARYAKNHLKTALLGASWAAQFVTPSHPAISFTGKAGDVLSLIPVSDTASGVTLTGVKWPLDDAIISSGNSRTLSNQFTEDTVSLSLKDGTLLVFHQYQKA